MNPLAKLILISGSMFVATTVFAQKETYPLHQDAIISAGVPQGVVTKHFLENSKTFPGTGRNYFVYVPAQYDKDKPAALMVFQDGQKYTTRDGEWRVPTVFDNLIHRGEMPVTIGLFVNPGITSAGMTPGDSDDAQDRFNRSFEYDSVSDRYATFIVDEMIPLLKKDFAISDDPNLRGIAGSSSGAIAAFGVAWYRPDQFRRVFSTVGTFVGLRGGNEFPTMIRKSEPKPIRVFLQDGSNDLNIYGGDWWMANQTMLRALQWAGYAVDFKFGEGGHNGKHGASLFPDAMKWLWADWEKPIATSTANHVEFKDVLIDGEDWELVSTGHKYTEGPAVAPDGTVYFVDGPSDAIWKVNADGRSATKFMELVAPSGLMFDADGRLYCAQNKNSSITRIESDGKQTLIAEGIGCNDLVVLDHGLYCTDPPKQTIWYVPIDPTTHVAGSPQVAGKGPELPNGIIVTPDKRFLLVNDAIGRHVWSYRIADDGSLQHGQPYHYVHQAQDAIRSGADGATMTRDGRLLIATPMGIQLFDQPGRSHMIFTRPKVTGPLSNGVLAGDKMETLYVTCGSDVFRRKTKLSGFAPWQPSVKPEKPRL